ncbi:I78 family peptidase inhibitor [Erwinia sp. V71]|uniref:I78 family peptidase inhibitor n=1 Tax=Erwinia sp. V71 TaxID=3369424 RepID=UPI003F61953F
MTFYLKALPIAALMLLAGCKTAPQHDSAVTPIDPDTSPCGAPHYQSYIGQPLAAAKALKLDNPVRVLPHNSAATMDFNLHRLNFSGDVNGRINRVYCG